jgi:hypothetical protein
MKKEMIAVLFAALILVQTAAVLAEDTSYIEPRSMTAAPSSVIRTIGSKTTTFASCRTEMSVSPRDPYFIGRQRNICVQQNKGNLYCQQQCIDKIKLYVLTGAFQRGLQLYSAASCAAADPAVVKAATSANRCYFTASNECINVNPNNDYCRRKCVEQAYAICRQNIATLSFGR